MSAVKKAPRSAAAKRSPRAKRKAASGGTVRSSAGKVAKAARGTSTKGRTPTKAGNKSSGGAKKLPPKQPVAKTKKAVAKKAIPRTKKAVADGAATNRAGSKQAVAKQSARTRGVATQRRADPSARPAAPSTTAASAPKARKPGRTHKRRREVERTIVRIRDLDPHKKCGPGTSVERLIRVDEMVDRKLEAHLVFFDRHGWYCEHGQSCHAVRHARRHAAHTDPRLG